MRVNLMMLANHAEVGGNELLYISGGGWDTINVDQRLDGAPEGVFAVMQGHLVIKLLVHATETDRDHHFEVTIMDDDGAQIAKSEGPFNVERNATLPAQWLHNVNIVLQVTGIPLPHEGNYVVNLTVDGQWLGDTPFRVIKNYAD